jgi:hypothetical protein
MHYLAEDYLAGIKSVPDKNLNIVNHKLYGFLNLISLIVAWNRNLLVSVFRHFGLGLSGCL